MLNNSVYQQVQFDMFTLQLDRIILGFLTFSPVKNQTHHVSVWSKGMLFNHNNLMSLLLWQYLKNLQFPQEMSLWELTCQKMRSIYNLDSYGTNEWRQFRKDVLSFMTVRGQIREIAHWFLWLYSFLYTKAMLWLVCIHSQIFPNNLLLAW